MSNPSSSGNIQKPKILSDLPPIFSSLHDAKVKAKLSFADLAAKVDRDEWYVAAIFYGQAKPDATDIAKLSSALNLQQRYLDEAFGDDYFPHRGLGDFPPQDPVLYRLYEVLVVYGYPLKHMIHEKVCITPPKERSTALNATQKKKAHTLVLLNPVRRRHHVGHRL